VFPHYTPAFGTFNHAFPLMKGANVMPPQGLLLIAAYMPESWPVRFIDENIRRATPADFEWADVVVPAACVQCEQVHDIAARAHAAGKRWCWAAVAIGLAGALSDIDYLHLGELGDATDHIIALIDESAERRRRSYFTIEAAAARYDPRLTSARTT
jgi:hypothetical protein